MFGRRRDEQTVDVIRQELHAADVRARAVLAEAMAQIETRLNSEHVKMTNAQESTQAAIENLRYDTVTRPGDIGRMLEQVSAMCALVAERIEADRIERRALSEAIALLANGSSSILEGASSERSRVIGGTVLASSDSALDADTIDIAAIEREPIDVDPIDVVAVDVAASVPETLDLDLGVDAPQTIDLEAEAAASIDHGVDNAIWNSFDSPRADAPDTADTLDLRPRRGTRLTAGRSNRDASWS